MTFTDNMWKSVFYTNFGLKSRKKYIYRQNMENYRQEHDYRLEIAILGVLQTFKRYFSVKFTKIFNSVGSTLCETWGKSQ